MHITLAFIFMLAALRTEQSLERKSAMENQHPKLRYVDTIPVETEQGEMIALRDPMGLADEIVLISREALYILQFFDGTKTVDDVIQLFKKQFRVDLEPQAVMGLLQHLDNHYYLDNERTRQRKRRLEKALLDAKVRVAAHAGVSYPAEPDSLHARLEEFFLSGAGLPDRVNGQPTPVGIVAPHIDLRIGGAVYTHAYRRLAEAPPADVYVILGTGHAGVSELYSVLPVDFETPLGRVPVDSTFIRLLQQNYPFDLYSDLFLHKTEHTIEFQVVFLQKTLADRPFKIVPILTGFSYHIFEYPMFEREREIVKRFTAALRQAIENYPGQVTVIASVDLAHVGPRYGDPEKPDHAFLQEVKKADFAALESVKNVDAAGWNQAVARVEDRYRICGFSPIYTLLASVPAKHGEILKYEQGLMDDEESYVSYCSAVLY